MNSPRLCGPLVSFIFCMALAISYLPAIAADSTSFNPLPVSVQAQPISGVPVGTIISWPVASNPEGWAEGNWLECNGQYISPSAYPELCAVVGGSVPDLRGLFLRGTGGNAAGLGSVQGDAIRRVEEARKSVIGGVIWNSNGMHGTAGAFKLGNPVEGQFTGGHQGSTCDVIMDLSQYWGASHTADEFRPVNRAVRYLIRARS